MVAREAAAILEEEAPFLASINRGREDEFGKNVNGYQKGDNVKIKIPPVGRVFDGAVFAAGGSATDSVETSVTLTLDTQKHVALQFGAKEKLLELTEFKDRILRPQMRTLASVVESDLIAKAYVTVPNIVGTPGSVPTAMKTYAQARAKLQAYLTPPGDRSVCFSSDANTELVDASKALFHSDKEIKRGFLRGTIGEAQGAMFYEHQSMPTHTRGTNAATGTLINGATAEGATSIVVDTGTANGTVKKGDVLTIAGVFAVHPLTGVATATLQQFVATADVTLSGTGTGTISVYPSIKSAAPNKTVSALPADNAAVTFVGAASAANRQNLMFQKDAFTAALASLPVLASCEGYSVSLPSGIAVRVMTFGDGNQDYERTRIDVLYGFAAVRQLQACRITE